VVHIAVCDHIYLNISTGVGGVVDIISFTEPNIQSTTLYKDKLTKRCRSV
jgi:hypothetical protein